MTDILDRGDPGFQLRGTLAGLIGARPDRERIRAVLELARSVLASFSASSARERAFSSTGSQALTSSKGERPARCSSARP